MSQFIAGQRTAPIAPNGANTKPHDVINPATGEVIAQAELGDVRSGWSKRSPRRRQRGISGDGAATPVGDRCQFLFKKYKQKLEEHFEELAMSIVREHGKTKAEANGDVRRGIDCVEFACCAPVLMMGRTLPPRRSPTEFNPSAEPEDTSGVGIDSTVDRVPLGVCVGITPFNFPVMVPLWMWPMAIACGNTFVLKPSEKVPLSAVREVELAHEAGLPKGVLNLVTGGPSVVDYLITHDDVRAVSFVGSTKVARHVYTTATAAGKRAQCMCGAKNYMVIMPDANQDAAIEGVIGSAFGNSGQRCLAGSACILVGDAPTWFIPKIKEAAAKIKVGPGDAPGCAMGPVIDKQSQQRIEGFIASGHKDGATCIFRCLPTALKPETRLTRNPILSASSTPPSSTTSAPAWTSSKTRSSAPS